jgi:tetratricopeptide (TPR) repeat protein
MRLLRRRSLALGLLGIAIALPAMAQPSQPQSPSPSQTVYPAPCEATKVSKADVERAHTVFLSGKQYLEESNYEKAISYFNDAYSIDCSVHGILPIIATAYERKGDKAEAIRALEEYQRRSPSAPDHEVIERRLRNLNDQLAREQTAAAAASAAASASAAAAAASVAPPPTASPSASAPPPAPNTPPPEPTEAKHTVVPWIVVGIGGAAVIAGGVMFGVSEVEIKDAEGSCPIHDQCKVASAIAEGNHGRDLQTASYYVLGSGLAVATAGLVWHFLEAGSKGPPSTAVAPVVAPGYAGVGMTGSF